VLYIGVIPDELLKDAQVKITGDKALVTLAEMPQPVPLALQNGGWKIEVGGLLKFSPQKNLLLYFADRSRKAALVAAICKDIEAGKIRTLDEASARIRQDLGFVAAAMEMRYEKIFSQLQEGQNANRLIDQMHRSGVDEKKLVDEQKRLNASLWKKVEAAVETVSARHGHPVTVPDTAAKIPADLSTITMGQLLRTIHARMIIPIDDEMAREIVILLDDAYKKEIEQNKPPATQRATTGSTALEGLPAVKVERTQ